MRDPKRKLSILLALIAVISLIMAVGGPRLFTTVVASPLMGEQTGAVTVTGNQAANVELAPHDGPNGQYAENGVGTLELSINGVNYQAVTDIPDVFVLTNNAGRPIHISVTKLDKHAVLEQSENQSESDRVTLYVDVNGNQAYDPGEALDGRQLPAGESAAVSIRIDARGFDQGDDDDNGLPPGEEDFFDELVITAASAG